MELSLPIYVEVRREGGENVHHCRPLFVGGPHGADVHLGQAMAKLGKRLKQHLDGLGSRLRHDDLAASAFAPELETHLVKLTLDLRERQARCKFLFAMFGALDRRIAFTPSLPGLWFEVHGQEQLPERAAEVLTRHFRALEKANRHAPSDEQRPEASSLDGQAWITSIDVRVKTQQKEQKDFERLLLSLLEEQRPDGDHELQRVGRSLDWLYPDELPRAVAREREVEQLTRLLEVPDNRPVVIIGPRLSGKTTVLYECVRQRVARRGTTYAAKQNVWLLSPQRLISGMMYVGQWEGRVQAILRAARKRRHVLYFDDFLGLYQAGISRDASLSVADVLKPFILRRDVRVLAEMTPAVWQAFQERDRSLADQFHVLRVEPTSEAETRKIMLQVHRQLELAHHSSFDLEALPAILSLHRSYIRDAAFPGKSAAFSRRLAQKYPRAPIARREVLQEFQQQTGLSMALVDERERIDRDAVVQSLQTKIIGQREAVEAAADVVAVAKARLAAPDRPLTTMLFLGPTGVGKTHCAKALAEVMFSDASRLLRFDMNEFVSPHAAAELVGTLGEPDGLLTAAVRRQPFSVVLLDEIEKAHPDVFDLLLQVTGEGRLTDSLGRTADFTNAVVIMTSNLGVTAGRALLGLGAGAGGEQHTYIKAAETFFRPEFFNRIDRIIPFESLSRGQMRGIAELLLVDVFKRDGLVRRRSALAVEAEAMDRIVDAGYHPQFGARALKRAIERQLVQPVAASLAGIKPELPAVINVLPQPDGVTARVHPLESVPAVAASRLTELSPAEQLERARRFVTRMEDEIESLRRPSSGSRGIGPEQLRYYAFKEQWRLIHDALANLTEAVEASERNPPVPRIPPRMPSYERRKMGMARRGLDDRRVLRDIHAAEDIHQYLRDVALEAPRPEELQERLAALVREMSLLQAMLAAVDAPEQVMLVIRALSQPAQTSAVLLHTRLEAVFTEQIPFDCEVVWNPAQQPRYVALRLTGPGIWPLATAEAGLHVVCQRHENLLPIQVSVFPSGSGSPAEQVEEYFGHRRTWLADLAADRASAADDPFPLGPIVRFYDEGGPTLDLRSGISLPAFPSPLEWKRLLLAGLPQPAEFQHP